MSNWIKSGSDADTKKRLEYILNQVLIENQRKLHDEVISRFFELLEDSSSEAIDTHGLEIKGLAEAAEALKENPEVSHTIYYDAISKEVYIRENNIRGMQNDIDLLSPHCPYICRVYRGQEMTSQEIADKVAEAMERNIMMALIDAKFLAMAEEEKTELLYAREGILR